MATHTRSRRTLYYNKKTAAWGAVTTIQGLPDPQVNDLDLDSTALWIATNEGLAKLDLATMRVKPIGLNKNNPGIICITSDLQYIWALYGKNVYISITGDHKEVGSMLCRYHRSTGKIKEYALQKPAFDVLSSSGQVYLAFAKSIGILSVKKDSLRIVAGEAIPNIEKALFDICVNIKADKKYVYFGGGSVTQQHGLLRYSKINDTWDWLGDNFSFPIAKSGQMLWVGSSYDINQSSDFVVKYIRDNQDEWNDMFFYKQGFMTTMTPDKDGLWIGTTTSILFFQPQLFKVTAFHLSPRMIQYSYDHIGIMGLATIGNDLLLPTRNSVIVYSTEGKTLRSIGGNNLYGSYLASATNRTGQVWFLTFYNDGYEGGPFGPNIFTTNITAHKSTVTTIPLPDSSLRSNSLFDWVAGDIVTDEKYLWLGLAAVSNHPYPDKGIPDTMKGLYRYNLQKRMWINIVPSKKGLKSDMVFNLDFANGALFAATDSGLFRYKSNVWRRIKKGSVRTFCISNDTAFAIMDTLLWAIDLLNGNKSIYASFPKYAIEACRLTRLRSGTMVAYSSSGYDRYALLPGKRQFVQKHDQIHNFVEVSDGKTYMTDGNLLYSCDLSNEKVNMEVPPVKIKMAIKTIKYAPGEVPEVSNDIGTWIY